jgi:hypothetical protein
MDAVRPRLCHLALEEGSEASLKWLLRRPDERSLIIHLTWTKVALAGRHVSVARTRQSDASDVHLTSAGPTSGGRSETVKVEEDTEAMPALLMAFAVIMYLTAWDKVRSTLSGNRAAVDEVELAVVSQMSSCVTLCRNATRYDRMPLQWHTKPVQLIT